jgi:glyoxylate reductase
MTTFHVLADLPLADTFNNFLGSDIQFHDLNTFQNNLTLREQLAPLITGLVTYGHPKIHETILDQLPNLRVISNHGVGVDHIDIDAARKRKLQVGHTPGTVDGATADCAMALILAAARRLVPCEKFARSAAYRAQNFSDLDMLQYRGRDVFGATLGIVGMGRIGSQVAKRAAAFDMRIMYHNRNRSQFNEQTSGATYSDLPSLLSQSDFVVICLPLTTSTSKMIGAEQLQMMKPTATLINVARGGVVDTNALVDALKAGTIWGAALDVTDPEPLPSNHPLFDMENVTIVPHIGSFTEQTRIRMAELTMFNLREGLHLRPVRFNAAS